MGNWLGDTWADVGSGLRKVGKYIAPDRPPDVTQSPAYQNENNFASGLGTQRSNFTGAGQTVVEGNPGAADRMGGDPNPNTIFADPTGKTNQTNALGLDKAAAEGNAPSAAEQLYRKGTDEGMQNQLNLAATTQGSNPGMSQRAGLAGAAGVANANAAGAGALRANEMATARDQYGNLATQTRGQTLSAAQQNQLANNQFYLGLTDEQQKAIQAMLGGAQANAKNQQDWASGNQVFAGGLLSTGGKIAAS